MTTDSQPRRRYFVPEVIQTSAMDCGPAVLKCVLEGFGIPIHYGRLREACQTDVDGTSIDVLESVAGQLGLQAEQVMVPVNHLLLREAESLPAILVVRLPNGFTHFILVWRRHGPYVQIMDPAVGRRWIPCRQLLEETYVHSQRVPAQAWHDWATSEGFRGPLARRLRDLGLGPSARTLIDKAAVAPGWRSLASLDAATRLAESLVRARGIKRGREVRHFLDALLKEDKVEKTGDIPEAYWSVVAAPSETAGEEQVLVRGAVLVRIRGRYVSESTLDEGPKPLSPELAAARSQPASRPIHTLFRLLGGHGWLFFVLLAAGLGLAAICGVLEAVLFRGVIDVGRDLGLVAQRLDAVGFLLGFVALVLILEMRVAGALLRLGRRLEARLRMAFFEKIPRLNDRYFQSRPTSDMAERSHTIHQIRLLPRFSGQFIRAALTLLATAAAIAWVDPASAALAFAAAAVAIGLPIAFNPLLGEMDLRVRTHAGALSRFYLDALLGLAAVRSHGAERAVRREHEGLLVEWARAGRRLLRWVVVVEGLQFLAGFGLAGWLLLLHAGRSTDTGGALLLAYWALSLPVLGEEIALLARQYPMQRNILLRLLEPLGALEEKQEPPTTDHEQYAQTNRRLAASSCERHESSTASICERGAPEARSAKDHARGVTLTLEAVTVRAAGQTILEDVHVHVESGSHVAIVGVSGAGKSSLVGLLLGWHRAACGRILIDGEPLDAGRLERLRHETAWIDPAIQLWNRSLVHNLLYGNQDGGDPALGPVLQEADLFQVLQRLPDGLQTSLGEGGGLLSGGEGQRVRLGRAFGRSPVRLAILDEPFRGLDRAKRRELLQRARRLWRDATLLCITHDVGETRDFERVLVVEGGHVVEDGSPECLAVDRGSRYRSLLDAEKEVREELWSSAVWRRLWLEDGRLKKEPNHEKHERHERGIDGNHLQR
jgi:ATP-binding cassette subfamily B protein